MDITINLTQKIDEEDIDISFIDMGDVSISIEDVTFNIDFDVAYLFFKKNVHFFMGKKNETLEETCKRVIDIHEEDWPMKVHELKTLKPYFQDVYSGVKQFEVRLNDRNFQVNDLLGLEEFDDATQTYTGRYIIRRITYILSDPMFVKDGFVIMGLSND
jgi:hypothetical protein